MAMILAESWWHVLLAAFFALLALLLMGVILVQRGRGMGLSNAFGGGGAAATVFGSKTGDFLTWATITLAGLFLLYSVLLNYVFLPPAAGLSRPTAPPVLSPGPNAVPVTPSPSPQPSTSVPPASSNQPANAPANPVNEAGGETGNAAPPTHAPSSQPGG